MILTGLLGGSFNPAHTGHRAISLFAMDALALDEVWWLVSPGNPLKSGVEDMAPLPARLASARAMARRSRIRATNIEARLGTRYTVDTIAALVRRYPNRRFIWIMGADNIAQFHRWRDWRRLARSVTIAIIARPGYECFTAASPASVWLRRFVRRAGSAQHWTQWRPPALVLLHFRPDPSSATALRRADPIWYRRFSTQSTGLRTPRFP
ncbi:nicotinate-nucleotide adenylyltransferase [Sphingomonas paeninsulae]|uniref:Probable nicotinate-nucleotide adenylyltransferase n=1 Tax=Sphingomonas paeninsulae TaxID=2319844 RepID=A0A494TR48_SPHPE|nr:nicotinate-nucleotide adenylyltransferase [Sphingomonas paeninsulae]AYJ87938.1 nicotinate-nucleotide adenylyltransferase [Sphingomonas paeninsulae]